MNQQTPESRDRNGLGSTLPWAIGGAIVFVVLNQVTNGKVPGGALGGAIGGVLGGLLGLGISSLRKK